MNSLEHFVVLVDHDIVTVAGSARSASRPREVRAVHGLSAAEPLGFEFTFDDWRDLWVFERMLHDLLGPLPFLPVKGTIHSERTSTPVSAIRLSPAIEWSSEDGEPRVRLDIEAIDHEPEPFEVPEDDAFTIVELAPADSALLRREVIAGSRRVRAAHPLR